MTVACRPFPKKYVFSAKGAAFITAWGTAPGSCRYEGASAESAIHSDFQEEDRQSVIDRTLLR